MAKRLSKHVAAADAAIDANMQTLRLEDTDHQSTRLFHLLVSLLEWADTHAVDFDETVSEVRRHFFETEGRATE